MECDELEELVAARKAALGYIDPANDDFTQMKQSINKNDKAILAMDSGFIWELEYMNSRAEADIDKHIKHQAMSIFPTRTFDPGMKKVGREGRQRAGNGTSSYNIITKNKI